MKNQPKNTDFKKYQIFVHHKQSLNEATRYLSDAKLLEKFEVILRPFPYRSNKMQHNPPTIQDIQTCNLRYSEDGKLICRACGLQIPTTPQGRIDTEKLVLEIASQKGKQTCPICLLKLDRQEA